MTVARTVLSPLVLVAALCAAEVCQAADAVPTATAKATAKTGKNASKAAADAPADSETGAGGADKGAPPPASSSPMAELKKSNAALDKVLRKDRPDWSPEAELQRAEVRKVVGSFLDYGELARRSLARHWDTLTPKQRQDFVNTLRQLVERSYLRQMHSSPNYNIKYEKEEKTGGEADVTATLNTVSRGKKVAVALEYKMLWKEGHWVVYDVLTDDQSMLENYRAEFNKIITKESFDALLNKMKKKLDEKDDE
ncbi:MAG TPA: ABC transporter substrate-binding protein [Polyangia bacterium]